MLSLEAYNLKVNLDGDNPIPSSDQGSHSSPSTPSPSPSGDFAEPWQNLYKSHRTTRR
jgi:hypothetical protein